MILPYAADMPHRALHLIYTYMMRTWSQMRMAHVNDVIIHTLPIVSDRWYGPNRSPVYVSVGATAAVVFMSATQRLDRPSEILNTQCKSRETKFIVLMFSVWC